MGYETKLVIGTVYSFLPVVPGEPRLMGVIATVDLSKAGYKTATAEVLSAARKNGEHISFYGDDGDTVITEDRYGDKTTDAPMDALIAAMEQDQADEPYRRFSMALGLLKAIRDENQWKGEDIRVVQFGH